MSNILQEDAGLLALSLLPTENAETVVTEIEIARDPLTHVLRKKLIERSMALQKVIDQVNQAWFEGFGVMQRLPEVLVASLASALSESKSPISAAIRQNIFAVPGNVAQQPMSEIEQTNRKPENELIFGFGLMARQMSQLDLETIVRIVTYTDSTLARALRQLLHRHFNEVQDLIHSVDRSLTQGLAFDDAVDAHAEMAGEDKYKPAASVSGLYKALALATSQSDTMSVNTKATVDFLSKDDAVFKEGQIMLDSLPRDFKEEIVATIQRAETPLATIIQKTLEEQANELGSLIQWVNEAVNDRDIQMKETSPGCGDAFVASTAKQNASPPQCAPLQIENQADTDQLNFITEKGESNQCNNAGNVADAKKRGLTMSTISDEQAGIVSSEVQKNEELLTFSIRNTLTQQAAEVASLMEGKVWPRRSDDIQVSDTSIPDHTMQAGSHQISAQLETENSALQRHSQFTTSGTRSDVKEYAGAEVFHSRPSSATNSLGKSAGTETGSMGLLEQNTNETSQLNAEQLDSRQSSHNPESNSRGTEKVEAQFIDFGCPRSHVELQSESWIPAKNVSKAPPQYDPVRSPQVEIPTNANCNEEQSREGPKTEYPDSIGSAETPSPRNALQTLDSISLLRKFLITACTRKGIQRGDQVLSEALSTESGRKERISMPSLIKALFSTFGIHLRKYVVRGLRDDGNIFEDGQVCVRSLLEKLNSVEWWPKNCELNENTLFWHQLRHDLERRFGSQMADALISGRNLTQIQSLLIEADRDEKALEEVKLLVEDTLYAHHVHQTIGVTHKHHVKAEYFPTQRDDMSVSPYLRPVSPFGPRLLNVRPATSPSTAQGVVDPDAIVGQKHQRKHRNSEGKINMRSFATHSDKQKLPISEQHCQGYASAESRTRTLAYSNLLNSTVSDSNPWTDNSERFWRRLPFPQHAIEYKRWDILKEITPGFSNPKQIPTCGPTKSWKSPTATALKLGSRFKEPFGKGHESLEKASIQMENLKMQRNNVKLVLQGGSHVRDVRRLVSHGHFDQALQAAACALDRFKTSGKFGDTLANQMGDPMCNVANCVKNEMKKALKTTEEHLKRKKVTKALSGIPYLRSCCRWLNKFSHLSPQSGHWSRSAEKGLFDTTQDGAKIEALTSQILVEQEAVALQVEECSISCYFAAVKEEFDSYTEPNPGEIEITLKRKNTLPHSIVADGNANFVAFEVKRPELPQILFIGTKLRIQGAGVLGSGRKDDGLKSRNGFVTAFSESSRKYKIQYADDFEWINWPCTNAQWVVELDIEPEDISITIPCFEVRSKTFNMQKHLRNDASIVIVAFIVTPCGPPFNFAIFGKHQVSVETLKTRKSPMEGIGSHVVQVDPPKFLLPASKYLLSECIHDEKLTCGLIEFRHRSEKIGKQFVPEERISLDEPGVYTLCCRGQNHFDTPCLTSTFHTCVVPPDVQISGQVSKKVLNRPSLHVDEVRVVLTWKSEPLELDTHIYTSTGQHISCRNSLEEIPGDVRINMDTTTGFGPETATLKVRRNHNYSFSVCLTAMEASLDLWIESSATVALYDVDGLFAMFHVPSVKYSPSSCRWWHVFALEGSQWDKAGHGVVRINKLMHSEMPQFCVPGWPLVHSARHGLWDEFCDQVMLHDAGKRRKELPMSGARDLANVTSLTGETLIGLICSHNEDAGEDPPLGNEDGITPLEKQCKALQLFLQISQKQPMLGDSLLNCGLPNLDSFQRECRMRGPGDCFIFRAIAYASTKVAVAVLNAVSGVARRSLPGYGYRLFLEDHSDELLMACIEKRSWRSLLPVLQGLLCIEGVCYRRATKRYQKHDPVQVETPCGSGQWKDGLVMEKVQNNFRVKLIQSLKSHTRDVSVQGELVEEGKAPIVQVTAGRLCWRSEVVERLRGICGQYQDQVEAIYFQSQKEHIPISDEQRRIIKMEGVYHEALVLVTEKAYLRHSYS